METNLVWTPHPEAAFLPAQLLQSGPNSYKAKPAPGTQWGDFTIDLAYNDPPVSTYFPVHETSLVSQDNLLDLSQIVEPAMLHQLRLRFTDDIIYTWISSILVSVNPFKSIKDLYTVEKMHDIMAMVKNFETKLPAHIFSTSANAYQQLCTSSGKTQISIIISGESGSGKTLCNNLFLQFFSVMSDKSGQLQQQQQQSPASTPMSPPSPADDNQQQQQVSFQTISQKIISSAVILEAFGNAKTVRNNNSSRFGKYIRLYFTHGTQQLAGASIESYLLEKSRITTSIAGERNYHVFYQLISGLAKDKKQEFSLNGTPEQFTILQGSQINVLPPSQRGDKDSLLDITGFDDEHDFSKTYEALSYHFDEATLNSIWRVLAGVLHLGNIQFEEAKGTTNDGCKLTDSSAPTIEIVCGLLGLDKTIFEQSLLSQKLQVGKDLVLKKKNLNDARGNLQSLIRSLFDTQFTWLIQEINKTLAPPNTSGANAIQNLSSIGILDIFGFEDFQHNSYEQLLINYTNEKLQSFFNQCVFEIELAEYRLEALDIDVNAITFTSNQPCLDLIETGAGCILEMIDDELKLPKGGDLTFLEKLDKRHEFHPYYTKTRTKAPVFTVSHYAAKVTYNVEGWLVKSKDDLQLDLAHCFTLSTIPHLRSTMTDFHNSRKGPQRSLGFKFRNQLSDLVKMLFDSTPYFVRCIKSNHQLAGGVFDSNLVLSQMKYLGLMSLVKIREVGYPLRLEYKEFLLRYNLLQLDNDVNNPPVSAAELSTLPLAKQQAIVTAILKRTDQSGKQWKLGKTKVFYRNVTQSNLERMRADEMEQRLMYLQTYIKTLLVQRNYNAMLNVINSIENILKNYEEKLEKQLLHEIAPGVLLPQITPLIPQAQQYQLEFDPTSHKRGNIVFTKLLQLQQRLNEQEDAIAFLSRALLANNKNMLLNAMNEVQGAYLTQYTQDRNENDLKAPQEVDLDQFETNAATLFQSAIQLYNELDLFDQLREKTEKERTLDLALSLLKTAQRLGVDKTTLNEIEALLKEIADEVAERKRKEEEEKKRKEEEERKRIEEEKRKVEEERQAREAEKKRLEQEQRLLAAQNKKLAEEEQQRLAEIEAAEEAQRLKDLEQEKEEKRKKMEEEEEEKKRKKKEESFRSHADRSNLSPKVKPGTPKLQPGAMLASPSLNQKSSSSSSSSSLSSLTTGDKRPKPDYNKISHFIETSNAVQLDQYLLQFQSISENFDHLMDIPQSPCAADRQYLLNLNTCHLEKPYNETLPIFEAVLRGDEAVIDVLVNHGANVNALNKAGQTPLWVAIKEGKFESAGLLIEEHGAAISRYDCDETSHDGPGHLLAKSLASLLSRFSASKSQFYIPLIQIFLHRNDSVIYSVENQSKHTAIQYFKKIIKSAEQQLQQQIQQINDKATGTPNAMSQHGVKVKNKDVEKDLQKCNDTLTFLGEVKKILFDLKG